MPKSLLLVVVLLTAPAVAADGLCPDWNMPSTIGTLDIAALPEASGIAISSDRSRFYLINDGARPVIHVIAPDGGNLQRTAVTGFSPLDLEDIALGPCGQSTCLYIADIGDNAERRADVQIAIVEEAERFADEAAPRRIVTAVYPDGPHDAEAIAVHPSGDLILVTKTRLGRNVPASVFRLSAAQLDDGGMQTFESLGGIPVVTLSDGGFALRRVVTGMDIAPDGRRFVLLTYDSAIEIAHDFADELPGADAWVEGRTHRTIQVAQLIQAEGIVYADDGLALIYTTESVRGTPAPLVRQTCRQ